MWSEFRWKTSSFSQTWCKIPPLTDNQDFSFSEDFVVDLRCVAAAVLFRQACDYQLSCWLIQLTPTLKYDSEMVQAFQWKAGDLLK